MKKTIKHAAAVLLGSLGGQARAKKLTVAERTAIARKAARTRSKNLTPARRREIAMMGVRARLAKLRTRRRQHDEEAQHGRPDALESAAQSASGRLLGAGSCGSRWPRDTKHSSSAY